MAAYIIKRILITIPIFFVVALVSFGIVSILPGDFYTVGMIGAAMMGIDPHGWHDSMRVMQGIDRPWIVQYWIWIEGIVFEWDFGVSFWGGLRPANEVLFGPQSGIWWTLIVTSTSLFWAWFLGIPLGILAALRRGRTADVLIAGACYAGFAFPQYIWGWVFFWFVYKFINPLVVGSGVWGTVGYELVGQPMSWYKLGSHILHLIPAWMIVGAPMLATVVRYTKLNLIDTLSEPYLVTARSKGLRESALVFKHALRNALNPLASIFGLMMPSLITGSMLTGALGIPTFGRVFINATRMQDQHVLTAALLFYSCILLFGNVISDILLALLDPRVRYS